MKAVIFAPILGEIPYTQIGCPLLLMSLLDRALLSQSPLLCGMSVPIYMSPAV